MELWSGQAAVPPADPRGDRSGDARAAPEAERRGLAPPAARRRDRERDVARSGGAPAAGRRPRARPAQVSRRHRPAATWRGSSATASTTVREHPPPPPTEPKARPAAPPVAAHRDAGGDQDVRGAQRRGRAPIASVAAGCRSPRCRREGLNRCVPARAASEVEPVAEPLETDPARRGRRPREGGVAIAGAVGACGLAVVALLPRARGDDRDADVESRPAGVHRPHGRSPDSVEAGARVGPGAAAGARSRRCPPAPAARAPARAARRRHSGQRRRGPARSLPRARQPRTGTPIRWSSRFLRPASPRANR